MAANDGEHPVGDLFGVPLAQGTGAGGMAAEGPTSFPQLAQVPVSVPNMSSQAPVPMVGVDPDDTASQVVPQHEGFSGVAGINTTGAGAGKVWQPRGPVTSGSDTPAYETPSVAGRPGLMGA